MSVIALRGTAGACAIARDRGEHALYWVPAMTDTPRPAGESPLETTATLLDQARGGDTPARERLFARFLPTLRAWAHHRLPGHARDLAETDDLVQITLARALSRLDTFEARGEGAFLAYLRQILLNAVREEIRRSARYGARTEAAFDVTAAEAEPITPLERLIGRESLDRYERALASLTEDQREAVILRLEFGYGYREVADAMGRAGADSARMLVVRAFARLAVELERD